jgi:lipid-A-disaccharide synthase-like uncharacterized protein
VNSWFSSPPLWYVIGMTGQVLFGSRFIIQWIASESARRSVIPKTFWYLSLLGGIALFAYAIQRRDIVFAIGQGGGLLVYARNLMLIRNQPPA